MNRIYINFIGFFNNEINKIIKNNNVIIRINNDNDIILFENRYDIKYIIDNEINMKNYFIDVYDIDINTLETNNIFLELSDDYNYIYKYYNCNLDKSIIIYKNSYNFYPLIYLGLPNLKSSQSVQIEYYYKSIFDNICSSDCSGNYSGINTEFITLNNNYFGNYNFIENNLQTLEYIYEICISDSSGITGIDSTNNYKLFNINNNIKLNLNTNIYFYNDINLFSYIIYLNIYSYSEFKNSSDDYDSIIVLINYIDNDTQEIAWTSVISLNLQIFNSSQLKYDNDNEYYNTLFFYNYINESYNVNSINLFDYDYEKYFINYDNPNKKNPEYYNINITPPNSNLYDVLIANDTNLSNPIILSLNYSYLFMNLDLIKLVDLIQFESLNNYLYKLTKSNKITLDNIIDYLSNYTIKKYNVIKINNIYDNFQNKVNFIRNYNYSNTTKYDYYVKNKNQNILINFNNNIVNCIRCKIIFYCNPFIIYSIDTKIFLNNYNLELYNKKYIFENISLDIEKKKLIKMLLFLATNSYKVIMCFYNNINNQMPSYNIFNQINLMKNMNEFNIYLNAISQNNFYREKYLKFNININKQYYILFLYSDINSFLSNYEELTFKYNLYTFNIFKIPNSTNGSGFPNGNLYENKELFYICFQNLKEINIFMNYIQTGILNLNLNQNMIYNYFNITKSIIFVNYYNLNNFWIINDESSSEPKNSIFFSINKLFIDQIYLQGNFDIVTL